MIRRNFLLTVSGESSKLNNNLSIYYGDFGIELSFNIVGHDYNFDNSSAELVSKYKPTKSSVRFRKPNSTSSYEIEKVTINTDDNLIRFTITKDMTDNFDEIGEYKAQIRLYDMHDHVLTLPPFTFLVKPLIDHPLEVDEGTTDDDVTGDDTQEEPNPDYGHDLENHIYNEKTWVKGEVVKAYDLNRMEEAIDYVVRNGGGGGDASIDDNYIGTDKTWSSYRISNYFEFNPDYVGPEGPAGTSQKYWIGTLDEYNSLSVKDDNTIYFII